MRMESGVLGVSVKVVGSVVLEGGVLRASIGMLECLTACSLEGGAVQAVVVMVIVSLQRGGTSSCV